ncbi:MAG: hypothetical protein D6812_06680 [Deltaproteobacteria bacterium]|nr:MAG: hypothetical protein D6812_06680 [Deltaproteobacteria bacterium]
MNEPFVNLLKGSIYALSVVLVIILMILLFKKRPWEIQEKEAAGRLSEAVLEVGVLESHRTNSLNPYLSDTDLSNYITECIFDGLWNYEYDPRFGRITLKHALAADLHPIRIATPERDENLFQIRIRPGLHWHDGRPLTARDVAFSLDYLIHNNVSRYFQLKKLLKRVEIQDEETLLLTFRKILRRERLSDVPLSLVTELLTVKILPAPPTELTEVPQWMAELARRPIGTGPFRLERNETDIVLVRNPDAIELPDPSIPPSGRPIERIVFRFFPVLKDLVQTFERSARGGGEINFLLDVSPIAFERLSRNFSFARYHTPYFYAIAFNGRRPRFQDREVRKALIDLMPRREIAHAVWDSTEIDDFLHEGPFNRYDLTTELELDPAETAPFFSEGMTIPAAAALMKGKGVEKLSYILLSEVDEADDLSNPISNEYKARMNALPLPGITLSVENTALSSNFVQKVFYDTDFDAVLLKVERRELEDYLTKDCTIPGRSDPICNISGFSRIPGGWEDLFLSYRETASLNEKRELAKEIHRQITSQALWSFLFAVPKRAYFDKNLKIPGGIHPNYFFSTVEGWYFDASPPEIPAR